MSCDHGVSLSRSCQDCNPPRRFEDDYGAALARTVELGRPDLFDKLIDGLYDIFKNPSEEE